MAEDVGKNPNPFDVRTIRHLVALMTQHDLTAIDLQQGDVRVRLRRGGQGHVVTVPAPAPVSLPVPAAMAQTTAPAAAPPAPKADKPVVTIKSPTPGTFYSASSPDAPIFVKVGSRVTPTTVVCIIEAMKIFNEIQAECSGVITEILVENQQPVEYGQVLFKVDPTA